MNNIPNELIIKVNTSIPGFQSFEFKPSMIIPDISKEEKTIYFNPLIKLNKDKIDSIPVNIRKKEFFNKGLFDSLIKYINLKPAKSLYQATMEGYVDNNIKVILNILFETGTVIYINKNPYTIINPIWSNGDWKIDYVKNDTHFNTKKINLKNNVLYGSNFSGTKQKGGVTNKPYYKYYNPHYYPYPPPPQQYYNYPPNYNYPSNYNYPYSPYYTNLQKRIKDNEKPKLAYYITIGLELEPGKTLSPEINKNLKCIKQWNNIKKSYSEFIGKPYNMPPIYKTQNINTNKTKTKKRINSKLNKTKKLV
jgi:hypothetical protein